MNKFNAKTNVLFLIVILVAGTFAAITPSSSFINGVEAQSETEYAYNSYAPIPEYQDNNNYNKLKNSLSIEKIKCNNININFLGNNTGDINLGNDGDRLTPTSTAAAEEEEGDVSTYSSGREGYNDEGYNNKQDIGFICKINNNNDNVDGNATDGDGNVTDTCEECFRKFLTNEEITDLIIATTAFATLAELCDFIDGSFQSESQREFISEYLFNAASGINISVQIIDAIFDYLEQVYGVDFPGSD